MTKNILGKGTLIAVLLSPVLLASSGCEQQAPKCAAGRGAFATKYRVVSGPPECGDLKGEMLGIATYSASASDLKPDFDRASIAIQSESIGLRRANAERAGITDADPNHKTYAYGAFTTAEPVNDFCEVPTLTVANQSLPEVAADEKNNIAAQTETAVSYEWKNVQIYVTPSAYGTQMSGDLTLTTNGVACQYSVIGLYPYVHCGVEDPNNPDNEIPDDRLCDAEPNAAEGRPTGSGINPDFPVKCDPDLFVCVLDKDTIPALR